MKKNNSTSRSRTKIQGVLEKDFFQSVIESGNANAVMDCFFALAEKVLSKSKYIYPEDELEDIRQELALKAWMAIPKYNPHKQAEKWIDSPCLPGIEIAIPKSKPNLAFSFFFRVMQNRLYDLQKESIEKRKEESEMLENIIDIEKEKLGMILAKEDPDQEQEQVIIIQDEVV